MPRFFTLAVEGPTDVAVVDRVLQATGHQRGIVHGQRGKGQLNSSLGGYNNAAKYAPWFVLRDLDHDADCAPALVAALLPTPASQMSFRVAVRAVEAWLLADAETLASFLRVRQHHFPLTPDTVGDPKEVVVHIARRSRSRAIQQDMVPVPGTSGRVGRAYASRLQEYAKDHWRPKIAALRSPSLQRCIDHLSHLS